MNKYFFILIALVILSATGAKAQVTIGSTADPKATLDIVKTAGDVPSGFLIPRVTLTELNDEKDKYTSDQIGTMVFVTDISGQTEPGYSDKIGCRGIYYWQGTWVGARPCAVVSTYIKIEKQPKAFTFYEENSAPSGGWTAVPTPLNFSVSSNTSGSITYQWYIITGSNINVRIAEKCHGGTGGKGGNGFNKADFYPKILRGTTKNANYTGFYRYFCRATNSAGDSVDSNIVEVAVGCGAKNMQGEWLSFLCFNLGATELTIEGQRDKEDITYHDNLSDGRHRYKDDEETVYGDLFQWGRIGDGHQKRKGTNDHYSAGTDPVNYITPLTNQIAYTYSNISYENGNVIGTSQPYPSQQVKRSTDHFGKFITTGSDQEYNWAHGISLRSTKDLLWRSGRYTSNDPCAKIQITYTGNEPIITAYNTSTNDYVTYYLDAVSIDANTNWRLPNQEEWGELYRGGAISGGNDIALANTWRWNSNNGRGYEIQPDGETTTLFLPAAGNRGNGNGGLYTQGSSGYYWSSTFAGTNAYSLNFGNGSVNPANINNRGYGFSLRCIKNN